MNHLLIKDFSKYKNVTTNLDSSEFNDIVFYNITDNKQFEERLKTANSNCIIVSKPINFNDSRIIVSHDFQNDKISITDEIFKTREFDNKILMGVTGTNGKTTTTFLIHQIIRQNNLSSLLFSTNGVYLNDQLVENFNLTTPDYTDICRTIRKYYQSVNSIIFEISSHALVQKRFGSLNFSSLGWTSFSRDHLDFHKDMNNYFQAKLKIFELNNAPIIVPFGNYELQSKLKDFNICIGENAEGEDLHLSLKTQFNLDNLSVAYSMVKSILKENFKYKFSELRPPAGRFEVIEYNTNMIIIDYAHTPDALHSLIKSTRDLFPGKKVFCLFGCGGDRDKGKRVEMALACSSSDKIMVTSDNPRTEDPEMIIQEIVAGFSNIDYCINSNRESAIREAISWLDGNKILLIAGKGHENYQIIGTEKKYFSDSETVQKYIHD